MVTKILVPVDGSDHAGKAVDLAADLAGKYGAALTLLHVMSTIGSARVPEELRDLERIEHVQVTEHDLPEGVARKIVERAGKRTTEHGNKAPHDVIVARDPTAEIVAYVVREGCDMIVMGSRGPGNIKGLLMGSVSRKVTHLAPWTCIAVK